MLHFRGMGMSGPNSEGLVLGCDAGELWKCDLLRRQYSSWPWGETQEETFQLKD